MSIQFVSFSSAKNDVYKTFADKEMDDAIKVMALVNSGQNNGWTSDIVQPNVKIFRRKRMSDILSDQFF